MPITSVASDAKALTLTVIADYPVPVERLWDAYADPRQIEKFWGPEEWPAQFTRHDMSVGGESHYSMAGPDGTKSHGWFHFIRVEPFRLIEFEDGPPGWTMPACEVASKVGESYRYEWEAADGSQRFGFEGELLESDAPHRAVTTERMIGMEGPGTTNLMALTPVEGGTLMTLVITYPTRELRDMVLGTGMVGGMEQSYARLEREVLKAA